MAEGFLLVESRKEKRLAKLVAQYTKAQDKAKSARVSVSLGDLLPVYCISGYSH